MSNPLLCVRELSKSFGERRAVDKVSFSLEAGRTLGLIGPNGAGKSTTVSMICGLLRPDGGEILINGESLTHGTAALRREIGLVPQDLAIYEDLSTHENLHLFGALYGLTGATLKSRCDEALDRVKLADRAKDKPATFSGGMKRRLNIAAALLHQPRLLILDEPTVGVDPQSRNAIFDSLESLQREGCALIYTSHYMEEVERLAAHIVIIDHGRVIADETPAALYRRLPAQAALEVEFAREPLADWLDAVATRPGVTSCSHAGERLHIGLTDAAAGLPLINWMAEQGWPPAHFATARADLEDIFLTLTGRTLRD